VSCGLLQLGPVGSCIGTGLREMDDTAPEFLSVLPETTNPPEWRILCPLHSQALRYRNQQIKVREVYRAVKFTISLLLKLPVILN